MEPELGHTRMILVFEINLASATQPPIVQMRTVEGEIEEGHRPHETEEEHRPHELEEGHLGSKWRECRSRQSWRRVRIERGCMFESKK